LEVTSAAVILLFVFAMFSGMKGNIPDGGYSSPKSQTQISQMSVNIPAGFSSSVDPQAQDSIYRYIKSRAKKISVDDMALLSESVMKYSQQYDVNPKLVTAMIDRESGFDPQAVSSSNAQGLAQLLPSTAAHIGINDPFSIDEGTKGAALYLKMMLDKWVGYPNQVPLALASYAEGPNQVARSGGNYSDKTAQYINDIVQRYGLIN